VRSAPGEVDYIGNGSERFTTIRYGYMPKRMNILSEDHARLHRNHSYEFLVATWLMKDGWQVFLPLLDAAYCVDLIASDGKNSYRLPVKSIESQDENLPVKNLLEGAKCGLRHLFRATVELGIRMSGV
jgi:hypothetical protein